MTATGNLRSSQIYIKESRRHSCYVFDEGIITWYKAHKKISVQLSLLLISLFKIYCSQLPSEVTYVFKWTCPVVQNSNCIALCRKKFPDQSHHSVRCQPALRSLWLSAWPPTTAAHQWDSTTLSKLSDWGCTTLQGCSCSIPLPARWLWLQQRVWEETQKPGTQHWALTAWTLTHFYSVLIHLVTKPQTHSGIIQSDTVAAKLLFKVWTLSVAKTDWSDYSLFSVHNLLSIIKGHPDIYQLFSIANSFCTISSLWIQKY